MGIIYHISDLSLIEMPMGISKIIAQRLKEKPLERMSDILREINDNRQEQHIEILVNDENVRLREFPHYKGFSHVQLNWLCYYDPLEAGLNIH